jgi:hypothetical protein
LQAFQVLKSQRSVGIMWRSMVPPPPAARPVARTDVWDVDPSTMDAMEIDVDAFIVKLRVARDNAFLLRTGGVMLAGGWTPGRDASTMKGKVQVATSPALMYTHQVCFSFHSVLDVRLRGRGARQVVVRARVAGGPFFCWRLACGKGLCNRRAPRRSARAGCWTPCASTGASHTWDTTRTTCF